MRQRSSKPTEQDAQEAAASPLPRKPTGPREKAHPAKVARAVGFMVLSMTLSTVITILDVALYPLAIYFDQKRSWFQYLMNLMGRTTIWPFCTVSVTGRENIPNDIGCIVAVNHQSWLDPFILAYLNFNFRAAFKKELLYYPGVGQALMLTGHLWVKRGDKDSGQKLMAGARSYVERGIPFVFFPEGTRKIDAAKGPLGEFKAGAFKVAVEAGVPVLPVTISGARSMLPPGGLPQLGWGAPLVTVHPLISSEGKDITKLMEETRDVIASGLRDCDKL